MREKLDLFFEISEDEHNKYNQQSALTIGCTVAWFAEYRNKLMLVFNYLEQFLYELLIFQGATLEHELIKF